MYKCVSHVCALDERWFSPGTPAFLPLGICPASKILRPADEVGAPRTEAPWDGPTLLCFAFNSMVEHYSNENDSQLAASARM